jgi:hypothetical protein
MELQWKHSFTAMIAGPTSCGKSCFTTRVLKHLDKVTDTTFHEIVYCAPESSYPDLRECKTPVKFLDCIPDVEMFADKKPRIIILDDLMRESDERVVDLCTSQLGFLCYKYEKHKWFALHYTVHSLYFCFHHLFSFPLIILNTSPVILEIGTFSLALCTFLSLLNPI